MIATTIGISYAALSFLPAESTALLQLPIVTAAAVFIAGVGVLADIHPENVALRLLLQTIAVAAVIVTLPQEVRALPMIPLTAERIGGLWFINLVNFVDGLDLMMVAETVCPDHGCAGRTGLARLSAVAGDCRQPCALPSDDRLFLFQSSDREAFSW